MNITRRTLLRAGAALTVGLLAERASAAARPTITVYKSPTCGCCTLWVTYLKKNGFPVKAEDHEHLEPIKKKLGVPDELSSCHTGVVEGYVIEGHVPSDLIDKLLAERPKILGIAVPGMPIGSPGMEVPGRPAERYEIVTFDRSGRTGVFATR